MAKQLVGPVEQHIDKAVLAVAVLVLIGAVVKYLVTSPNHVELRGEAVSPSEIDDIVAARAADTLMQIQRARPTIDDEEDGDVDLAAVFADAAALSGMDLATPLPAVVPIAPDVPEVGATGPLKGFITLADVVPLSQPVAVHGRTTLRLGENGRDPPDPPDDMYDAFDKSVNWVTVSAVFDRKAQVETNARHFGSSQSSVIFAGIEVQRQEQAADGTWPDDGWVTIDPLHQTPPPETPEIKLIVEGGEVVADEDSIRGLETFIENIEDPKAQLDLIRPLPPVVRNGDPWRFPIITSRRDVLMMDDEYLFPNKPPAASPEDRYTTWWEDVIEQPETTTEPTGQQRIVRLFKAADELMQKAEQQWDVALANDAAEAFSDLQTERDASQQDLDRAARREREARQLGRDIRRHPRRGKRGGTRPRGDRSDKRPLEPKQQVWAIDARPGSVKGGKTYRYRMRALIYNPYAAAPKVLKDHNDATKPVLVGAWSEPSAPVAIEPATRFFVSNSYEARQTVAVEIYQWVDGVWVKGRARVGVGDGVAVTARSKVPLPNGEVDNAKIDFDAGATIVDIDFDRPYRQRRKKGRTGVRFESRKPDTVVVLRGKDGRLIERFLSTDKASPERKALEAKQWRPPRPVKEQRPRRKRAASSDLGGP
ncbi:MAG: hypothetical protein ACE5E6_01985 [Phycisphaerae bacterium]